MMKNENVIDLFGKNYTQPEIDPCDDQRVKDLFTGYLGSGVRSVYPAGTYKDETWGDTLPKNLRRAYGTKAPALGGRAPRPINAFGVELANNYRWIRYIHIIIGAWAGDLPLTRDMHKNLLSEWHQKQYLKAITYILSQRLAHEVEEDWSDMPLFHSKPTDALHVRPTRILIYQCLEMIAFFYDCLAQNLDNGLYVAAQYLPDKDGKRRWPAFDHPIPNDVTARRVVVV